jgi:serine/threonine protein kinase/Tol biopolymer transport system component
MSLAPGTKLGPYEIESALGSGGMGEVYRATDTRLHRTVAIKILPAELSSDPQARERFEREARTISSLNHPNICVLHDIGSQNGTAYLVLECVKGESLDVRLQKGPLPLKQLLEYGVQICDALDKAHRAGIVHRDLKPGNMMLTSSGIKLLDFGLAKPARLLPQDYSRSGGEAASSTPTINVSAVAAPQRALTEKGTVVGTFQYMAPETLQGQEADARSDIFSLGCVLYEMATGRRAFEGKSQISIASAILDKEPEPISKLQPMAPAALEHVIGQCLAKDPELRWQSAADIARELQWVAISGDATAPTAPGHSRVRERWAWAAALLLLTAALLWSSLGGRHEARVLRSYLPPPPDTNFDSVGDFSGPPVITADGSAIAFCARPQNAPKSLWVQSLNELTARKLEGTDGASFPFWSADGRSLGFFADGHLKKVPAAGGPVIVLADAPNPRGGTWNQDNVILYEPDYRDTLWRVSASGGTPARATTFEAGKHTTHRWPKFLPDGKHFLFFAANHSGGEQGIYFGSLADGSYKRVLDSDSDAQYASGYLLYHLQSALLAQKFDPSSGAVSGEPINVANFVEYDSGTWHATFAASQSGLLVYEPGSKTLGTDLLWVDRKGRSLGKVAERGFYKGSARFSPDGTRLTFTAGEPQADVWVMDLAHGNRTRLTFGGATHLSPSWSPDGQRVVYVYQGGAAARGTSLRSRPADGGGQEQILLEGETSAPVLRLLAPQWSTDGRYLLYIRSSGPVGASIWALPMSGERKPFPVVQPTTEQGRVVQYRLSPDGQWLAFSSTDSGREEVYVTRFPAGQGRWEVSQHGGSFPTWSRQRGELFYISFEGTFNVAEVKEKPASFEVGQVQPLFPLNYTSPLGDPYDVAPDGKRFIFASVPLGSPTPLVLVTNWAADLKN